MSGNSVKNCLSFMLNINDALANCLRWADVALRLPNVAASFESVKKETNPANIV